MPSLTDTVADTLCERFDAFLGQAHSLAGTLSEQEFWARPYPYGNSAGHLVLHLTGNLNYFIGTVIAGTGYVRHRDLEFSDDRQRPKAEVLADLAAAVEMVKGAVRRQSADDWSAPYSAVGTDERNRFGIVVRCTHHFHHHLGQMIYLCREHAARRP